MLPAWLSKELQTHVEPQLMQISETGAAGGMVLIPMSTFNDIASFSAKVRSDRVPSKVALDALRSDGYKTSGEHTNSSGTMEVHLKWD